MLRLQDRDTHTAAKWLTSPVTLVETSGPDVLVGSFGSDMIKKLGGNDIICPIDKNSGIYGGADVIYGGAGNDDIMTNGVAYGGSGNDDVLVLAVAGTSTYRPISVPADSTVPANCSTAPAKTP